jgi:hypothetical protein
MTGFAGCIVSLPSDVQRTLERDLVVEFLGERCL